MLHVVPAERLTFDDLTLHYQPQISADGKSIVSVEALLRARRPGPGSRTAADILAHFADPQEAEALDWWVLRTGCTAALNWPTLSVGINVGADRFRDPSFAERLIAMVGEIGVEPSRIELEIVESSYIGDFDSAFANITRLRAHGLRIALDDFGTGFSSLGYLNSFRIDEIKIDRSFVNRLVDDATGRALVQAIITLGHALGLEVVAEGVETQEQAQLLGQMGCDLLQGFLYARPMPANEFAAFRCPAVAAGSAG